MTLVIKDIPFVDENPKEGQQKLSWIQNGELLEGGESGSSSGNLNETSVQLYKNIKTINENFQNVADNVIEQNSEIESLKKYVGDTTNVDLVQKVDDLTNGNIEIRSDITTIKSGLTANIEKTDALKADVGEQNPNYDSGRSVRDDIFYVKTQIGNAENKDLDGNVKEGNPSTGLKRLTDNIILELNSQKEKIGNSVVNTVMGKSGDVKLTADDVIKVGSINLIGSLEWTDIPNFVDYKGEQSIDLNKPIQGLVNRSEYFKRGLTPKYDPDYSLSIGGYPKGAELLLSDGITRVVSLIDNNGTDPNSNISNWRKTDFDSRSVVSISTYAELSNVDTSVTQNIFYKLNSSNYYVDLNDTTTAGNGNTVLVDGKNRRWKLVSNFVFAENFNAGKFPSSFDSSYHLGTGSKTLGDITLKMRNKLSGEGYGTALTDSSLTYSQNQVKISDLKMTLSDVAKYAITSESADSISYFSEIDGVTINNGSGVKIGGVETFITKSRVFGEGRDNRANKGFYCTVKGAGDLNDAIDTSFSMIYTQAVKQGFNSKGAVCGFDGHFVWADQAIRLEGTDSVNALPSQKTIFGSFLDKSYVTGAYLYGATGVALYSPHVYELGMYQTDSSIAVTGIRFQNNSAKNFISAPTFNVTDLTKVNSLLWFSDTAIDNTIIHANGSYKMDSTQKDKLRKQNFIAGTGEWAKHNNFARLNRGIIPATAAAANATVDITLDYSYDLTNVTFNALLFHGNYMSRLDNMDTQFGEIYVSLRVNNSSSIISNVVLVPKGGYNQNNIVWTGVDAVLVGNKLTLTFKNGATSPARMSLELQRSIDTGGLYF